MVAGDTDRLCTGSHAPEVEYGGDPLIEIDGPGALLARIAKKKNRCA